MNVRSLIDSNNLVFIKNELVYTAILMLNSKTILYSFVSDISTAYSQRPSKTKLNGHVHARIYKKNISFDLDLSIN